MNSKRLSGDSVRSLPGVRCASRVGLSRHLKRIVDLNAEIPYCAFELDGLAETGPSVDSLSAGILVTSSLDASYAFLKPLALSYPPQSISATRSGYPVPFRFGKRPGASLHFRNLELVP